MNPRKFAWPLLAAICLSGGAYVATLTSPWLAPAHAADTATAKPTTTVRPEVAAPLEELSRVFRTVHNAVKDSVVNINTSRKAGAVARNRLPDEFRRMLPPELLPPDDDQDQPAPSPRQRRGQPSSPERLEPFGTGSGVIISPDGYIVTNNHVVEDADAINVRLDDGRNFSAKVIGRDPKSDLAVIKIDAQKLTYAKFGDSDALDVGDWVLAFGSPFRFDQTMTQGIISAKGRQPEIIAAHNPLLAGLTYENYLQTDAAINPGNSGGPLVNLKGEVVGINAAIASASGGYNGIGFSIPANDVKWIADSLIKNGKVVRGYMGIGISDINDPRTSRPHDAARSLGYDGDTGILVGEIRADSPAGQGGLKLDDIIVALNGKKVTTVNELRNEVARTAPGTKITLTVFRGGKTLDVTFSVGTQPETAVASAKPAGSQQRPAAFDLNDLGLSVTESSKGLVIENVDPDGLAAGSGLSKGDVIFKVQNNPVNSLEELKNTLGKVKLERGVRISVHTADGSDRSVFITAAP